MIVLVAGHSDVAFLTPVGVPTVLADPVFFAGVSLAVPDDDDSVIDFSVALRFVVVARLVELERVLSAVNTGSDGSHSGNRLLQSDFVSDLDLHVSRALGTDIGRVESALVLLLLIRIRRFRVNAWVILDVNVSICHVAAVATVVFYEEIKMKRNVR